MATLNSTHRRQPNGISSAIPTAASSATPFRIRLFGNVGERQRRSSDHECGEPIEKVLASSLVVRGLRELRVQPFFPESLVVDVKRAVVLPEPGECLHLYGRVGLRPRVELACLDRAEQFEERRPGLPGRGRSPVEDPFRNSVSRGADP